MFKTMKSRLTAIILFILFCVFTIQLLANYLFAETYYINQKRIVMDNAYRTIREATGENEDNIIDIMSTYEYHNNLQFTLANSKLNIVYSSKQYSFNNKKNKKEVKSSFNFKRNLDLFSSDATPILKERKSSRDILILYGIIELNGQNHYLVMRTPIQAVRDDMNNTNMFILYVSAIALIIGTVFVYLFAKKTAEPIEEIELVANHISNFNFSIRARELNTKDEIGRLSKSINRMADKLEENISQLQAVNEKLEEENEYKTRIDNQRKEFIANLSHELKTPLAVLGGYTEMLKDNQNVIDKEYYYDVILDEVSNMSNLVANLLDLSSMENGLWVNEFEEVDITEIVRHVISKNNILFQNKDLNYTLDIKEHYNVLGDSLYLERAFTNYITNAIKYTNEGKSIVIKITGKNEEVEVTVFNEGSSIPASELDCIWDQFYRLDKARTRDDNHSMGIGLNFVRSIINAHHGKYGVRNVKGGVEFWFSLKIIQ